MNIEHLKKSFQASNTGSSPIYVRLANYFRLLIKAGELSEGSQMIPEEEICQALGISRTTVRQAMNLLVEQGLLVRYRGKGTFISQKKYNRSFNHLYNFSSDMEEIGVIPSSLTLKHEIIDIRGTSIQETMELSDERASTFHLKRVRLADNKPVLVEDTYIPYFLCPGIENHNFDKNSLYEVLKNTYNLIPYSASESLQGILIPKYERTLLQCEHNTVGYKINRIARLDSNFVYEYTTSITRADICAYQFQLNNSPSSRSNSSMVLNNNVNNK